MSKAKKVIEFEQVNFSYQKRLILQDVNLNIHERDRACIIGPNGGGKTTLVKLMVGLLKPTSGKIKVYDKVPEQARDFFAYVPQQSRHDSRFPISVYQIVAQGRINNSFSGYLQKEDREIVDKAIEDVGLQGKEKQPFSTLSGGQKQKTLIARALASQGKILILDEPTSNIDQLAEQHFFALLEKLNQDMTIIMVTHEVGFASSFFARIICVNRKVATHPASELTGEHIRDIYGSDLLMIRHDHNCSQQTINNA